MAVPDSAAGNPEPPQQTAVKGLPCAPQTIITCGNLSLGATFFIINFLSIFTSLATFRFYSFTLILFIAAGGLAIAAASLLLLNCITNYFGFLQYPAGTGSYLTVLGVLSLGRSTWDTIIGSIAVGWGVLSIVTHCWLKSKNAAVNVPLLSRSS